MFYDLEELVEAVGEGEGKFDIVVGLEAGVYVFDELYNLLKEFNIL